MKWLKLHAEICTDPKIRLLAFEDRWHYVALLCAKADGLLDDDSPIRERLIRVHLGLAEVEAESLKKRLREVCLIDEDWCPTGWEKRQSTDPTGAERKRKQREKARAADPQEDTKHDAHGTVTGQSRDSHALELEGEGEEEIPPLPPLQGGDAKPRLRRSSKTAIPKDLTLTSERRAKAERYWAERGRADLDPDDEFEVFGAHHRSRGTRSVDWDACWQTWYSNAVRFTRKPPETPYAGNRPDRNSSEDRSAAGRVRANVARARAERAAAEAGRNTVAPDGRDVRPPLDVEFWRSGGS